MRRQKLPAEMRDDVLPKNILMIGPTGVGKTEIARRLAKLAHSPFLKVEASKFTEVGYVGRDVESMIRDLVEIAVNMVRDEQSVAVRAKAEENAEERLLDLLLPPRPFAPDEDAAQVREETQRTRERLREQLREGRFDDRIVEIEVREKGGFPSLEIITGANVEEVEFNLKDMMPGLFQGRSKKKRVPGARSARSRWRRKKSRSSSTWTRWRASPSIACSSPASSSSTRSTRSPDARAGTVPTSAAKACSATSCRSSKARRSTPSTAWCAPITSCLSRRARFTSRSHRI